jgi:hypothetical protein
MYLASGSREGDGTDERRLRVVCLAGSDDEDIADGAGNSVLADGHGGDA